MRFIQILTTVSAYAWIALWFTWFVLKLFSAEKASEADGGMFLYGGVLMLVSVSWVIYIC